MSSRTAESPANLPPNGGAAARQARWCGMLWVAGCMALALAGFVSRRPQQWFSPQFWAEDGTEFFFDSVTLGWLAVLKPYAGYFHLVPRLIAGAASPLPWEYLPAVYMLAAAVIAAAVTARVAFSATPPLVRVCGAIAVIAVPHSGEVFLNLTNVNWLLGLVLIVNLLEAPDDAARRRGWRAGEVLLAGLSGPIGMCLFPFALLWAHAARWRRETWIGLAAWTIAAGVQAAVIAAEARGARTGLGEVVASLHWVSLRYVSKVFLGDWVAFNAMASGVILAAVVGGLTVVFCERGNRYRAHAAALLLAAGGLLVVGRLASDSWGHPLGGGARYTYLPLVLALLAMAFLAAGAQRKAHRFLALALWAWPLVASTSAWQARPQPDFNWRQQVREVKAGARERLEVPPGLSFAVPRKPTQ